jgi:hypothetical protein
VLVAFSLASAGAKNEKLKPEELISRHLASIGLESLLKERKTNSVTGLGKMNILTGGQGFLEGPATFLSEGRSLKFLMDFQVSNYSRDHFVFDGNKVGIESIRPGMRSPLGEFLFSYDQIVKEGLVGGVLSVSWPLVALDERKPKLKYRGLKKVGNQRYHALEYRMKKSKGVEVDLYFHPETFQHVQTRYRVKIPAGMGSNPAASAGMRDTYLTLDETFSDFRKFDGLTLPTHWRLLYSSEGSQAGIMVEWVFVIKGVEMDSIVPDESFRLGEGQ